MASWSDLDGLLIRHGLTWTPGRIIQNAEQRVLIAGQARVWLTLFKGATRFVIGGPASSLRADIENFLGTGTPRSVVSAAWEFEGSVVPLAVRGKLTPVAGDETPWTAYRRPYRVTESLWVRSRAEFIIATKLAERGLDFYYERAFAYLDGKSRVKYLHPDFFLPEYDLYLEYWGLDDEKYALSRAYKQAVYCANDVFPFDVEMDELEYDRWMINLEVRLSAGPPPSQ